MIGLIAKIGKHIGGVVIPYEDLLTFTEVDPNSDITITKYVCTFDTMQRGVAAYVYKDYGVGYFGDFEIEFEAIATVQQSNVSTIVFALVNTPGSFQDIIDSNVGVSLHLNSNAAVGIKIQEYSLDNGDEAAFDPTGTLYYYKITRVDTTLTCYIYSDAARTVLVDTLTITGVTTLYRYLQVLASRELAATEYSTGYTQNFDINPNDYIEVYDITSVDENGDYTISQFKIHANSMRRDANSYNYIDYGVDYFGDFEIQCVVEIEASENYSNFEFLMLANTIGTRQDHLDASEGIGIQAYGGAGDSNAELQIYDNPLSNSDIYEPGGTTISRKYCTWKRVGTTLTLEIYSDAARTVLVDTLTITCSSTAFRYLHIGCGRENTSVGDSEITAFVEKVKIITAS